VRALSHAHRSGRAQVLCAERLNWQRQGKARGAQCCFYTTPVECQGEEYRMCSIIRSLGYQLVGKRGAASGTRHVCSWFFFFCALLQPYMYVGHRSKVFKPRQFFCPLTESDMHTILRLVMTGRTYWAKVHSFRMRESAPTELKGSNTAGLLNPMYCTYSPAENPVMRGPAQRHIRFTSTVLQVSCIMRSSSVRGCF
jgi:hypothetical protein